MAAVSLEKVETLAADVALAALAWYLAHLLAFRFAVPVHFDALIYRNMMWVLPIHAAAFVLVGLYREASLGDGRHSLLRLSIAAFVPSFLIGAGLLATGLRPDVPRAALLACPVILLLFLLFSRGTLSRWIRSAKIAAVGQRRPIPIVRSLNFLKLRLPAPASLGAVAVWLAALILCMWYLFAIRIGAGWRMFFLGILMLPAVWMLRTRLMQQKPDSQFLHNSGAESSASRWRHHLAGLVYAGIFLATVAALKTYDIGWHDFDSAGLRSLGYIALRVVLAVHLGVLCFGLGSLLLAVIPGIGKDVVRSDLTFFIPAFFLGASVFGLAFALAGLSGILSLPFALLVTVPVAFAAPRFCGLVVGSAVREVKRALINAGKFDVGVCFLAFWCALLVGALTLVSRGLYPLAGEPDVWAHYLHYYRAVLETGSTGPNEVWYHFFISKAAGVTFLAGLLSDALAVQLEAAVSFAVTCLILFQVLRRLAGSAQWAWLGVALFAAAYDGTYYKHHVILTGYIAFLTWAAIELVSQAQKGKALVFIAALVSSLYIGFYQPLACSLVFGFFVGISLIARVMRFPGQSAARFISLAISIGAGAAGALALNYSITGLAEFAPLSKMMQFADSEKLAQVFSRLGLAFFLGEQSEISGWIFDLTWLLKVFRYEQFVIVIPKLIVWLLSAVAAFWLVAGARRPLNSEQNRPWIVIGAFLLPAIIVVQAAPVLSTYRLFTFAAFFGALVLAVLFQRSISWLAQPTDHRLTSAAVLASVGGASLVLSMQAMMSPQRDPMWSYLLGKISLAQAMHQEMVDPHQKKQILITKLRREIGPNKKVFALNQADDPNMAFPGRGLITEPSYDFGKRHEEIVFGDPELAKSALISLGIDYFYVPVGHNAAALFSSVAFSELVAPTNLDRYFQIALRQGGDYVLTWRTQGDTTPLPSEFSRPLELHQSGVLYYFYQRNGRFARDVEALVSSNIFKFPGEGNLKRLSQVQIAELSNAIAGDASELMRTYASVRIALPGNKRFIEALCNAISRNIAEDFPEAVRKMPWFWQAEVVRQRSSSRIGEVIRTVIRNRTELEFVPEVAGPLLTYNARVPYGTIVDQQVKRRTDGFTP